jgi:HK97 family phage prohead protease
LTRSDWTSTDSGFRFAGYASLFNVVDLSGDTVLMGAFHRSLRARGVAGIRMLWNHDPAEPIGVWTAIREDSRGLRVEGRLTTAVARARSLAALIRDGALDGLSIGFHTLRANRPKPAAKSARGRRLIEVDLWEVSLVAFPMQPGAHVDRIEPGEPAPPPAHALTTHALTTHALPTSPATSPSLQA